MYCGKGHRANNKCLNRKGFKNLGAKTFGAARAASSRSREGYRWFKFDHIEVSVSAALLETFPERLPAEGYTEFKAKGRLA